MALLAVLFRPPGEQTEHPCRGDMNEEASMPQYRSRCAWCQGCAPEEPPGMPLWLEVAWLLLVALALVAILAAIWALLAGKLPL